MQAGGIPGGEIAGGFGQLLEGNVSGGINAISGGIMSTFGGLW
jgi:hypothetical protein